LNPDAAVNIEQLLASLRRRALVIVLSAVLVAAAAFAFSEQETKLYTATTSLLFSSAALSQEAAGLPAIANDTDQQSQQDTNVQLIKLGDMATRTAAALGNGLTPSTITRNLTVAAVGDTSVVRVSAVSSSPTLAANIANTYSNEFVDEQQSSNQAYYENALALVSRQLADLSPAQKVSSAGLALEARVQSLGTLAELRSATVQVAQAARVPGGPSSPRTFRNTVFAGFFGLLVGLGVAFLLERSDRLIREPRDLANLYGLPLLGAIPESAEFARWMQRDDESGPILHAAEAEVFHLIRAHLRYFNVDRELHTLLVASAAAGDGKTTVACHLAGAAARMRARVLLIETDVRRPMVAAQLHLAPGPGLSDVLIGVIPLAEAIQTVSLEAQFVSRELERTMDVLPAGSGVPPNPAELIESQAMEALLERAKAMYDFVVLDTPPLNAVSDAFPLLGKVDGVIIVGRVGRDRRDVAQRTRETLQSVGAPLLGVIANGVRAGGRAGYGYSYGYSQTGKTVLPPSRESELV
jgi:capsular exopolysaccharide synthesis family protein